jgi:hypothetical protein
MNSQDDLLGTALTVKRIKILSFFIDENDIPEKVLFKVDFNQQFVVDVKSKLVFTILKVWYSIPTGENDNRIVLDCRVQNIFEIANIDDYLLPDGKVLFPNEVLINITSMSITHTRAVLAIQTSGTIFGDTLVPVVNPVDATMAFFNTSKEQVKSIEDVEFAPILEAERKYKIDRKTGEIKENS